jgi:hypothetical protein
MLNMETKKYQRPQLKVKCEYCGIEFMKDGSEVRRNKKNGRKLFCSLKCSADHYSVLKEYYGQHNDNLRPRKRDKYSDFREYIRRIKIRQKERNRIDCTITLDDLLEQWEIQGGKCVYSGVELKHKSSRKNTPECTYLNTASLDRIDSSKGYVKGNIQFISVSSNHAKNNLTHNQMIDFCKLITRFWKNK